MSSLSPTILRPAASLLEPQVEGPMEPMGSGRSERVSRLKPSLVREILSTANRPDMISFAGGLPATDLIPPFPAASITDAALYQYGPSEGEPAYREAVARWTSAAGLPVKASQILALAGSQQGLDLAAKLLIDRGTPMLTEAPTYLAALQVFEFFGADIASVPLAANGPDIPALERMLATHRPRCIYLVPTFQNPTGACYSPQARAAVAELLDHYGTLLIEDEPYRSLALDVAHPLVPISAHLKRAPWIYLGSFSKILWPGLRQGYLAAREDLMRDLVTLKQASDLHTQRPGQIAVANWMESSDRETHLDQLRAGYTARRSAMNDALHRHFGTLASWQVPAGGLFFWIRLNHHTATRALLSEAANRGVVFMPGEAFYPTSTGGMSSTQWHEGQHHMRLNFSHATPDQMDRGLGALASLIRQHS